jgi:hypothetical protein
MEIVNRRFRRGNDFTALPAVMRYAFLRQRAEGRRQKYLLRRRLREQTTVPRNRGNRCNLINEYL